MKKEEIKKNDQIKNAMDDFSRAIKLLEQTVKNLHQTEKNMKVSRDNFNRTLQNQREMQKLPYSYHGINTFEEKANQLNDQFISVVIENQFQNDVIIFESTEKDTKIA